VIDDEIEHGAPYEEVEPKRSWDQVPVVLDWHDFLINKRAPGVSVQVGYTFRPFRVDANGLEYRCTKAGVTSGLPTPRIRWAQQVALPTQDGGVIWTAQEISSASLRDTIATQVWVWDSGVTPGATALTDMQYQIIVAGGSDGIDYKGKHQVTLTSSGEKKEGVIVLPVRD
jgi:hypothetical protein